MESSQTESELTLTKTCVPVFFFLFFFSYKQLFSPSSSTFWPWLEATCQAVKYVGVLLEGRMCLSGIILSY